VHKEDERTMENVEGGIVPAEDRVAGASARRWSLAAVLRSRAVLLTAGALIIGGVLWYLQFSTASICCGDYDAYYHFRWSRMLWESMLLGHFPPAFNALPLTTLNPKDYVDHHFLFHVLQIPFTWFSDMQTGAKIGTWLFACLSIFSCYWLIVRNRLSYPLVWLVAILGSSAPFLYRINMGKAMSVSIVMLVVGINLLFRRKYVWLLPLAFVFALTYDMVFLLGVAAVFWLAVVLWQERALNREVARALTAVFLVAAGIVLGFVINPYFPHNLQLLYEHIVIKITSKDFTTQVGSEWYPYTTLEFLGNCGVALAAMFAGFIAFRNAGRKEQERAFFFLLFSTLLMIANARWRRFSEYFPPFAVLFAAFALEPLIRSARERLTARETLETTDEVKTYSATSSATDADSSAATEAVHSASTSSATEAEASASDVSASESAPSDSVVQRPAPERVEHARAWEFVLVGTAFVLLCAPLVWYARVTSQDIAGMAGPNFYRGGVEWLSKNADKGELILNTDWDDFPKLFFYNPDLAYVSGLDPTYLLDKNQKLNELYAKITIGKDLSDEEVADLGATIRENFCTGEGAERRCVRYAFTDKEHEDFFNNALDSGWFDVVYEDSECAVLRLREQKGEPPPDNVRPEGQNGADDTNESDETDEPDNNN
jgi:hypothetical protein